MPCTVNDVPSIFEIFTFTLRGGVEVPWAAAGLLAAGGLLGLPAAGPLLGTGGWGVAVRGGGPRGGSVTGVPGGAISARGA